MKQILLICLLFVSINQAKTQTYNVDSLAKVLESETLTANDRMETYHKLAKAYANKDLDLHRFYSEQGLLLAKKEKNLSMLARFNGYIGINYQYRNKIDSAEIFIKTALDYAIKAKDKTLEAEQYNALGVSSRAKGDIVAELEYYRKVIEINEQSPDRRLYVIGLINISSIYRMIRSYDEAEKYLNKALAIANESNLYREKIYILYGLGEMFFNLKEVDKSINYFEQALELCMKENDKEYASFSYHAMGLCHLLLEDFVNAEKFALKSLEMADKFGSPVVHYSSWYILAHVYLQQKNYAEAEYYAMKAWGSDVAESNLTHGIAWILGMVNMHKGDKEKTSEYFLKYKDLINKNEDENLQQTILGLEAKYETEKKETRIAMLENERKLYTWLIGAGGLLLLALLFVLLLTRRNARKEKQLIATRAVMDGEMRERARLARDLHDRLSGNLSAVKIGIGNQSQPGRELSEKINNCIDELRRVSHNLMPASLQYGMKVALGDFAAQFPNVYFHFFGEEKRVEERIEFVVYCCASELVNNSIKHSGAKNINLQLIQEGKHVSLTVEDDGCGYDLSNATDGIGLKSVKDRVASCNGKIDVVTAPGKGTETSIELNV